MIVVSLLLILGAAGSLAYGLLRSSDAFLIGSIAASLLAAILLIIGVRQAASPAESDASDSSDTSDSSDAVDVGSDEALRHTEPITPGQRPGSSEESLDAVAPNPGASDPGASDEADTRSEFAGAGVAGSAVDPDSDSGVGSDSVGSVAADSADDSADDSGDASEEEDPPDEPGPQEVDPADAAKVARLDAEVMVVDGRPRYHLAGCYHLLGRESEGLPIGEANELGFTPCSLCEPDTDVLERYLGERSAKSADRD